MPVTMPVCAQDHPRGPGKAKNLKQSPTAYPKRYWLYFWFWFGFWVLKLFIAKKEKKNRQATPKGTNQGLPKPGPLCVAATDQRDFVYASGCPH